MPQKDLSSERWERICAIASTVLDTDTAGRNAILARECSGDNALRDSVLQIVSHYSESEDLLGLAVPTIAVQPVREFSHGDLVGAYCIERKLGEGGMGRVYLASRADNAFTKNVAIKITAFPSSSLESRFRQERSILAQMEHPGIARLLDAGSTAEGSLYVVMEYVDGTPVDAYCDQHGLNRRARLLLFDRICAAVSYAHSLGVLHCDLKPSNVFVDGAGTPKLLDFGLAKEGNSVAGGTIGFTPEYASPELANEGTVGTYSDVYSLGVLLGKLLREYAENADLKSIIARATAHDPRDRYRTVVELAADIKRFRQTYPVQARAGNSAYRTGKFLRRNYLEIVASIMILMGIAEFVREFRKDSAVSSAKSVQRITSLRGRETYPSISPDGGNVAFASLSAGNWDIFVRTEGGEPRNLTAGSGVNNSEPAFSPDGKQIAFRSDRDGGGIFLMSAQGGAPRKLSARGYLPAWSPDGRELALCTATFPFGRIALTGTNRRSQLFVVDTTSGQSRPLTDATDLQDAVQVAWAPDGKRIAFWGIDAQGEMYVYTAPALGAPSKPTVVFHAKGVMVWNPFWSPSGKYLYYDSSSAGTSNLWRIPVDRNSGMASGQPVRITLPVAAAGFFSPSQDGRRLAYTQDHESWNIERSRFEIAEFRVGETVPVTEGANHYIRPTVSPDGEWVTFQTPDRPSDDIYVCRTSGGPVKKLTQGGKCRYPRWKDNDTIEYGTTRNGKDMVVSVRKDGTGEQFMTPPLPPMGQFWRLSEKKLLFSLGGRKFFTMENMQQTPFKTPNGPDEIFRIHGFSADRSLAVASLMPLSRREENPLQLYDAVSGKLTPLGVSGANAGFLRDERYIKYTTANRIMILDRKTGQARKVLHPGADELSGITFSADQKWLYFSRSRADADVWLAEMDPPL